jgi:Tol biopolymer transport system component
MTVVTPPRPSDSGDRLAPAPDALEALIEEARQRARRRRMRTAAAVLLVAATATVAFAGFGGESHTGASANAPAAPNSAAVNLSRSTQGRIAFVTVDRRGLWNALDVVAGGGRVRTLVRGFAGEPAWSPDGRRLVFVHPGSGIWIVNRDGSGRRLLLPLRYPAHLTWSPDGRRIAFLANGRTARTTDLGVVNANGSGFRILSAADHDAVAPNGGLAWSPDGNWIAFQAVQTIRIERTTGGHIRVLWRCSNTRSCVDPSWSPDGSRLLFSTEAGMMVADNPTTAAGRPAPRVLVHDVGNQRWSPDGRMIAFETDNGTIELTDANGRNRRQLTKGHNAVWSPDGKALAFLRWRGPRSQWAIYTIRSNGTGERLIARYVSVDYPAWGL